MKKLFSHVLLSLLLLTGICSASTMDFDFSGTFSTDNEVVLLNFSVGTDSTITIFSSSWQDGGFDPILAIWNASGSYVSEQDDGHNTGSTFSNSVSYNHGDWDSYYDVYLAAGNYTASIAQYDNFRNGNTLSEGFTHDGYPNFTFGLGYGAEPFFNGVLSDDDARTGAWAFHILNVDSAEQQENPIPEPTTMLLFGLGLLGLAGVNRKKQ